MRVTIIFLLAAVIGTAGFVAGNRWGHRAADRWWGEKMLERPYKIDQEVEIVPDSSVTMTDMTFRCIAFNGNNVGPNYLEPRCWPKAKRPAAPLKPH